MNSYITGRKLLLKLFCLVAGIGLYGKTFAQCTNQVTDTIGTSIISGISVTVTPIGTAFTNIVYCASTTPYAIGQYISSGITANNGYSFQFSPPVDSVTLNFSGLSNTPPYQEIVILEVNGIRYSIPSPGSANGCDAMAMLTTEGYITGCINCSTSGWNGTHITGPISTISVIDSSALNGPGGNTSLFSIFFCGAAGTGIQNGFDDEMIKIYPNPFTTELNISTFSHESVDFILYDIYSKVLIRKKLSGDDIISTDQLKAGLYLYELRDENGRHFSGKVIKH